MKYRMSAGSPTEYSVSPARTRRSSKRVASRSTTQRWMPRESRVKARKASSRDSRCCRLSTGIGGLRADGVDVEELRHPLLERRAGAARLGDRAPEGIVAERDGVGVGDGRDHQVSVLDEREHGLGVARRRRPLQEEGGAADALGLVEIVGEDAQEPAQRLLVAPDEERVDELAGV